MNGYYSRTDGKSICQDCYFKSKNFYNNICTFKKNNLHSYPTSCKYYKYKEIIK